MSCKKKSFYLLILISSILFSACAQRFTSYIPLKEAKFSPIPANKKIRLFVDEKPTFRIVKIGEFTITRGSGKWQYEVAKKYARRKGADLIFLTREITKTIITYSQHGVSSIDSWTDRTFIFARELDE